MTPALSVGAFSLLLLIAPDAAAAGFYDTLNDLRAGRQSCPAAKIRGQATKFRTQFVAVFWRGWPAEFGSLPPNFATEHQ